MQNWPIILSFASTLLNIFSNEWPLQQRHLQYPPNDNDLHKNLETNTKHALQIGSIYLLKITLNVFNFISAVESKKTFVQVLNSSLQKFDKQKPNIYQLNLC